MHMVQQTVQINGRAVVVLESGSLYRVESLARQRARLAGRAPSRVYPPGAPVFHTVRAATAREAISVADDPNSTKEDITSATLEAEKNDD